MPPPADRSSMEAHVLNQEVLRLDTMTKQRILLIRDTVRDERSLQDEIKHTKDLLASLRSKIEALGAVTPRLLSRAEQSEVRANVARHEKELGENTQQLRTATLTARKLISETARTSLLTGGSEETTRRRRQNDQHSLQEDAKKTTERLSDIVAKMGERVAHSETTMDSLVHSSAVLADTQSEFEGHTAHIQTGNKLLSKYERRELTDKILVTIAIIFYIAVVYYILQKRVFSKFWLF